MISHKISRLFVLATGLVALVAVSACTTTETVEVIKEVPVEKVVTKEVPVEVEKIVTKEVPVEVEKIVTKEVPVEVEKEVIVEKEVERVVTKVLEKEVVVVATAVPAATEAPAEVISAPTPKTDAGVAVIAINEDLGDENGRNAAQASDSYKNWGVAETLFQRAPDDSHLPWLATDFTVADDLSSATVTIKEGVSFQSIDGEDFGNMTAADVAFSMNDSNSAVTPDSIHGQAGDFAGLWGEWTAVDDTTITFDFTQYDSTWKDDYVNQSGQAFPVLSKKAFDEKGADWVRDNVVATGVYEIDEWKRDESVTLKARDDHHQFTAKTANIKILGVKEPTTRLALLRNGEVDIAHLEPKDAAKLDTTGFTKTSTGAAVQLGVFFSGNLWEDTYAGGDNEGQTLPTKATFVHDLPWIGSPGKHGDDDLEQAKSIRTALAWAIDRDAINEKLLAGTGDVVHVEYFNASHANWDAKWEYGYDPDKSFEIIKALDPDYQKGSASADNSILGEHAFEVSVYAGPELGGGASITGEVADAVAGYWADLGLTTFTLKFSYQTFRPTVVGRSNTHPWITSCDKGKASNPWHFPKGLVQTTLTRGGFSCGFESPEILGFYTRMAEAKDTASATAAANEYLDYVYDQALQPGVVGVPDAYYFNNNKIKSFDQDLAAMASLNSLWNIELK